MQQIYGRTTMPKCDFNKVALQVYWNHTSTWVSPVNLLHIFSTFSQEHFWVNASVLILETTWLLYNFSTKRWRKKMWFKNQVMIFINLLVGKYLIMSNEIDLTLYNSFFSKFELGFSYWFYRSDFWQNFGWSSWYQFKVSS